MKNPIIIFLGILVAGILMLDETSTLDINDMHRDAYEARRTIDISR